MDEQPVDIVTPNDDLARGDAYHFGGYFGQSLGISFADNLDNVAPTDPKPAYEKDIVYGTIGHFIGDDLSDLTNNVKNGRPNRAIYIDEMDNVLIDQISKMVQKAEGIPGFEYTRNAQLELWILQNLLASRIYHDPQTMKVYILKETDTSAELFEEVEEIKDYLYNYTLAAAQKIVVPPKHVGARERIVALPKHSWEFAHSQAEVWTKKSIVARLRPENETYVIANLNHKQGNDASHNVIAPVDEKTGTIELYLNLDGGLTQFFQIKHALYMSTDSLTSVFMSYVNYILKYSGNINGMTGTFGEDSNQVFINQVYGGAFLSVPAFQRRRNVEYEPIISYDDEVLWLDNIAQVTLRMVRNRRAILIVVETVKDLLNVCAYLRSEGLEALTYGDSLDDSTTRKSLVSGIVVVSSSKGGRGTDWKPSSEVLANGGLHVILSYHPESNREDWQIAGRSGRNGNMGSFQKVLNLKGKNEFQVDLQADPSMASMLVDIADNDREKREAEQLLADRYCRLPRMLIQDHLYANLTDLIRGLFSATGKEIVLSEFGRNGCLNNQNAIPLNTACVYRDSRGSILVEFEGFQYERNCKLWILL